MLAKHTLNKHKEKYKHVVAMGLVVWGRSAIFLLGGISDNAEKVSYRT